jgi:hypothetical protein
MDADVCDGSETCNQVSHVCVAGQPLVCNDGNPCTVDSCHPVDGCLVDRRAFDVDGDGYFAPACGGDDCDDQVASTHPGAPEICADGVDNDCVGGDGSQPNNYYRDCDQDGFAPPDAVPFSSCMPPSGTPQGCSHGSWTTRAPNALANDCRDDLAIVMPGAGFAVAPITGAPAAVDFDYNCDGVEEREYPLARDASSACVGAGVLGCSGDVYWAGTTAPACGTSATLSFCRSGLLSCSRDTSSSKVACR